MMAPDARYVWAAEHEPIARRAHHAFWQANGQSPVLLWAAESVSVGDMSLYTDLVLVTLRCSPFTSRNAHRTEQQYAALAELCAVMQGVFSRTPKLIIYENTAHLLRLTKCRDWVEAILSSDPCYVWRAILTSPHAHSAFPLRRWRIFYVGIRRERAPEIR